MSKYLKGRKYLSKPDRVAEFYKRLLSSKADQHRIFMMRLRVLSLSWYLKGMVRRDYDFKRPKDKRFLKYGKFI